MTVAPRTESIPRFLAAANTGATVSTEDVLLVGGVPGTVRLRGRLTCNETMPVDIDIMLEVISRDARLTQKELLLEEQRIYSSD